MQHVLMKMADAVVARRLEARTDAHVNVERRAVHTGHAHQIELQAIFQDLLRDLRCRRRSGGRDSRRATSSFRARLHSSSSPGRPLASAAKSDMTFSLSPA